MSSMFGSCHSLTTLDVSKFNTSNVTNMSAMFSGCDKLTTLDLSNLDTSNVTNMSYMFSYCRSLKTLDISNWNTSNVTDITELFSNCDELTTIKGVIDMKSCTSYDNIFYEPPKLTGVKFKNPSSGFTDEYALEISSGKIVIVQ